MQWRSLNEQPDDNSVILVCMEHDVTPQVWVSKGPLPRQLNGINLVWWSYIEPPPSFETDEKKWKIWK